VLDIAEVTTMQLEVVDIDAENKIFFVKVREAFLDTP
jgi:hypothetical protein